MKGTIRTKEKCPKCGGKFEGEPLSCPACLTHPNRYFLDFSWPGQGRFKLYSGKDGHPLDSYARAFRLLTAIRHEIDQGKFDPKEYVKQELKALQFDVYVQRWLSRREKELESKHKPLSIGYFSEIKAYVHRYFIPFFGRTSIRDIREGQIEDFRDWLPAHLSRKTVRNILGVLHKFFKDAYRRRDALVLPEFPIIGKSEPVTRWLSESEQEKVLRQMKDPIRRAFYLFLVKQGCRPGEVRALRWENLDLKNDIVIIASAFDREEYRPYTKELDVRYLPLHPLVNEAILSLPRSINGWVFTYQGKHITQWMASVYWRRAARKAGIKANCYEGTRHSLASQAINRGVSERKIGDMLGHKDLSSTRRYAEMKTEALKEVWGEELSPLSVPNVSPKG